MYPCRHTLSLHDALPISGPRAGPRNSSTMATTAMAARWSPTPRAGCFPRAIRSARRVSRNASNSRISCAAAPTGAKSKARSEEHTSELQSLMRISYAVFCLKKKTKHNTTTKHRQPRYYQTHKQKAKIDDNHLNTHHHCAG